MLPILSVLNMIGGQATVYLAGGCIAIAHGANLDGCMTA